MNDSFDQHSAQTPSPVTGSRQDTHSVGSAMSSASRAVRIHAPPTAPSALRTWLAMVRDGDAEASMGRRLALQALRLKRKKIVSYWRRP